MRAARGFGLVELMVALAISSLLLLGITQLFIASKDSYRVIEGLSRVQENARFAIDSLSRDLRHSGLYGCRSGVAMWGDGQTPRFQNAAAASFETAFNIDPNTSNALQGYNATGPAATAWLPSDPVADGAVEAVDLVGGSDMLVIRGSVQPGERVQTVAGNTITVGDITVSGTTFALGDLRFGAGDSLMIASCDGATLFDAQSVDATNDQIVSSQALGQPFDNTAELYVASTVVYHIRNNPNGIPSLFRRVNGNARELVTGVQNMQILFGEDTTNDADIAATQYVDARDNPTMEDVVSVRIGLLMVSPDSVRREAGGPQNYQVLEQTGVLPFDRRSLHQLVVSTITFRNRAFPQ